VIEQIKELSPEQFTSLVEEKDARIAKLEFELAQLRRLIFGAKSERFAPTAHPSQLNLLEEPAIEQANEEAILVDRHERKKKKEKHPVRQPFPASLPREVTVIYPEGFNQNSTQKPIGEEITEILEEIPGKLFVKKIVRPKYADQKSGAVVIAPMPSRPIDKGVFGTLLLTRIIIEKYCDHLPLYRQLERLKRSGIKLAYSTVADVPSQISELLVPLYDELVKQVLSSRYLGVDETPHPVLDKDVKQKTHRGFFWVYQAVEQRLVLFDYKPGRGKVAPTEFLKNFKGFLQTDGYQVYDSFGKRSDIERVGCMAHARRYFENALNSDKSRAEYILSLLQKVYAVERQIGETDMEEQEIVKLRNSASVPVLAEMKSWLDEHLLSVRPQSPLGKAIGYTHARWDNLTRYLNHAFLRIDNNLVENAIRPTVLGRKNYLFSGSHEAAKRSAMFYSFIGTCKLNQVNPEEWLADILEKIKDTKSSQLFTLLPNNWRKP
jgi:transposase